MSGFLIAFSMKKEEVILSIYKALSSYLSLSFVAFLSSTFYVWTKMLHVTKESVDIIIIAAFLFTLKKAVIGG